MIVTRKNFTFCTLKERKKNEMVDVERGVPLGSARSRAGELLTRACKFF